MKTLKTAVIGVGVMGSKYAMLLQSKQIAGMELAALTRIREPFRDQIQPTVPVYESAELLFEAVEQGLLALDAVIIATPHYSHEKIAVRAFQNGLHVLSDKPAGVYSAQSRRMKEAAESSGRQYGMVFQQRFLPVHQRIQEIVQSGKYGRLKRLNWTLTDWYRPEKYYQSSQWRATWAGEGGGVLLNQCPHNLDLLCWICGNPARVQAFCHEGHYHNIQVEDDVTAYLEWENGATGTFVTSTGDAPGVNRLEITLEEAFLVCENGTLKICELEPELRMKEAQYRRTTEQMFRKLQGVWHTETVEPEENAYQKVLQNFADSCNFGTPLLAPGAQGHNSLLLANAMYLSSWQKQMVALPEAGSSEERAFEQVYEEKLLQKGGHL